MSSRVLVTALFLVSASLAGCKKEGGPKPGPARRGPIAFPVEVEPVEVRAVEYVVSAVGSVEAFERVQVTARVAGAVEKVRFIEGQKVKQGEVLAEIEPSRFSLAVRSAQAALEKAEAAKAEADAGLSRRAAVDEKNPGLIRGEELETWRTRARTAAAELSAAKVALDQAELNLRDAYVRAPVGGILQTRTVQTGQYVQPGAVLATMIRRDPLLLRFRVPEADASRLSNGMAVRFTLRGEARPHSAKVTHIAAAAEESSRMVAVTAEIDDPERERLLPGAFAEVTAPVGKASDAPVIPQTAVRPSERGFLAFVVEGGVARERVLTLGLRTPDGRVEVRDGVRPGDQVVVRGAEALREGAPVRVAQGAADAEAAGQSPDGSHAGGRP